jgi:hypothetical protein
LVLLLVEAAALQQKQKGFVCDVVVKLVEATALQQRQQWFVCELVCKLVEATALQVFNSAKTAMAWWKVCRCACTCKHAPQKKTERHGEASKPTRGYL